MSLGYTSLYEGRSSSFDYEEGTTIRGLPVRFRIHQDFYPHQSYAKAEVFSPATLSWNEVAQVHWRRWAQYRSPAGNIAEYTEGIDDALNELNALADATLPR